MKKTIFAIVLMASLLAGAVETGTDSYLYWMVDVTETDWHYDYSVQVKGVTDDDPAGGSLLNLYYGDGKPVGGTGQSITSQDLNYYRRYNVGFYAELLSSKTYTSYVFELVSDSGVVAQSEPFTEVKAYITGNGISSPSQLGMLMVAMPLPVPEPSSGLLLLLGVAGLALRRRKQITA